MEAGAAVQAGALGTDTAKKQRARGKSLRTWLAPSTQERHPGLLASGAVPVGGDDSVYHDRLRDPSVVNAVRA